MLEALRLLCVVGNSSVSVQCEGVEVIEFMCLKTVRLPRGPTPARAEFKAYVCTRKEFISIPIVMYCWEQFRFSAV